MKAENFALRDAVRHVACPNCGGPANLAEMSYEEQQLRIENARLREEVPTNCTRKTIFFFLRSCFLGFVYTSRASIERVAPHFYLGFSDNLESWLPPYASLGFILRVLRNLKFVLVASRSLV